MFGEKKFRPPKLGARSPPIRDLYGVFFLVQPPPNKFVNVTIAYQQYAQTQWKIFPEIQIPTRHSLHIGPGRSQGFNDIRPFDIHGWAGLSGTPLNPFTKLKIITYWWRSVASCGRRLERTIGLVAIFHADESQGFLVLRYYQFKVSWQKALILTKWFTSSQLWKPWKESSDLVEMFTI